MKCTNKKTRSLNKQKLTAFLLLLGICFTSGCGKASYAMPYTADSDVTSYRIVNLEEKRGTAQSFASELCVADSDVNVSSVDIQASGAALFDLDGKETLYAKNIHEKLYPASLTKIMTALVALKHGSADMMLTASSNVTNLESGAAVCGIKEGDRMTLTQALHLLLINSANDAGIMIAEGVAGSVEAFADMMNQEALALGATNTHFVNPHGLSDDNHYTTVYDMYLITNEAMKYEMFSEIVHMSSYTTVYNDRSGNAKEITVDSTNYYLNGNAQAPGGITVLGGKTGTTNAAGHCLILISRDSASKPYISIIMRAEGRDVLYTQMTDLLEKINN